MSADSLAEFREELLRTCRTTVGDELRTVTYFTEDDELLVYIRDDLEWGEDVGFVENEREGFRSQRVYDGSELGNYRATVRMFEGGYLTRVIVDEHGAFVTTDRMPIDRFEDLAAALRDELERAP